MCYLHVRNVGHGICMAVDAPCVGTQLYVDCGSMESACWAAHEYMRLSNVIRHADAFVLSHFHFDHYNGLLWLAEQDIHSNAVVETACYPRIPDVDNSPEMRSELLRCMIAFTCYQASQPSFLLLGDNRRSIQRHFASVIRQVSRCPQGCREIAAGDSIHSNNGPCHVLWPPRRVSVDDPYGRAMKNGIIAFRAAAESDPKLREIYELISESGLTDQYLNKLEEKHDDIHCENSRLIVDMESEETSTGHFVRNRKAHTLDSVEVPELEDAESLPTVRKANTALREVADLLSLAFRFQSSLLFLGDLKSREIRTVVSWLNSDPQLTHYDVLIAAHHGTRWDISLQNISVNRLVVSSIGGRYQNRVRQEYGQYGVDHHITNRDGHLTFPLKLE